MRGTCRSCVRSDRNATEGRSLQAEEAHPTENQPMSTSRAVFLDRDGVLIDDTGFLVRADQIRILDGVPAALQRLKAAGFQLIVVSNQSVIARGAITEVELGAIHVALQEMLQQAGAPALDAIYYCPHHPEATLIEYRQECQCRKPRSGMLLRGAAEHGLDLQASFLVGDRMTDIVAGVACGCRGVLVTCGRHADPTIVTVDPLDPHCRADHICPDLAAAADWILKQL